MVKKREIGKVNSSNGAGSGGKTGLEQFHKGFWGMAEGYIHCRVIHENEQVQDWVYLAVNDTFERQTGAKGIVGKRASEVMPEMRETHPGLFETCSRVSQTGQPEKFEMFVKASQAWFSISVFSMEQDSFAAIFEDITARKESENNLRERMEYFRTVANFTYDWEYWLDDQRRVLYTSPSCERITGYSAAMFEQDPSLLERIVHPQDRSLYRHHQQEEITKAEPLSLDFRIVTTDGEIRWINHACQQVRDAGGRPMGRRASNRDITRRRQMEQALRENESILTMSEEVAKTGSWRWDLRTRKAAWSDQMFRLFEVEREDFDGDMNRVIAERVHPDDAEAVLEFNRSILKGISSVASITCRIVLPGGMERTVRAHGKLVRDDDGHPISMTGYVQEITEWVKVKNQFRQMKRLYAALSQVNRAVARARDIASLYSSVCEAAVKHGELAAAWVELLDEASGELHPVSASGLDVDKWSLPIVNINRKSNQNGIIVEAFRNCRVAAGEDLQTDERTRSLYKHFGKFEFRSLASAPIQAQGKTIGVLSLASTESGFFKAEEEIGLVEEIGLAISCSLERGESLRESEGKMQSIFRAAPTGIGVVTDRMLLDVNTRVCEMTGYSKEELIGQSARMLYPTQEEFEFVGQEKYRQISEKGTGQVETRWLKKDGSIIDVLLASTPIDVTDRSKGVTFTALDITDRKQTEKALRKSEERHRQVSALMSDYVYCGQVFPDGSVKSDWVSGAFERITGYSLEEINRMEGGFSSLVYREDLEAVMQQQPTLLANGSLYTEYRITRKDGEIRWLSDYMKYLEEDKPGTGNAMIGAVRDITEQKQAGEALRQSEEKFKYVFDNSTVAKSITTVDSKLHANRAFCEMLGYSAEELENKPWREITHPDDVELNVREVGEILSGAKETARFIKRYIHKDGSTVWVDLNTSLRRDENGNPLYFVTTALDITERKRAEEELQKSEEQFRQLAENIREVFWLGSTDWNQVFYISPAYEEIWGRSRAELYTRPRSWLDEIVAEDFQKISKAIQAYDPKTQMPIIFPEYRITRPDGSQRWIAARGFPVFDTVSQSYRITGLAEDITERKRAEEELRQRENLLNKIFDVVPVGLWLADKNGRLVRSNQAGREIWGAEPLVGQEEYGLFKARRLPNGEEVAPDNWALAHTIREGITIVDEMLEIDCFDGRKKIILNYTAPVLDDAGKVDGAVIVNLDITERMKAEKVLRESEDKFRKAFMTSPDSVNINRIQDGMYISINPGFTQIMGYTEADVIGKTSLELNIWEDPRDRARLVEGLRKDGFVDNLEASFRRKDGGIKYGLMSASVIELGGAPHILSITRDITDRKLAEEAIHQSERQMKALLTSLDDIVFEFDRNGTYLNIWAADESLLVLPKAQMLGKNIMEIMGRESGSPFDDAVKRSLAGNIPQSIEYPLEVIGGKRWFMARVSPILSPDGSVHTASVLVRDITEHKRIEEQVQVQLQRVRALNEIDRAISSSLDMRLSLDILLIQTLSQLGVDAACVLLLNPSAQTLEYVTGRGFRSTVIRDSRVMLGQGFPGQAGLERRTMHVPDIKAEEGKFIRKKLLIEEGFVEYFCVPLIAKGMLKGVLEIFNRSRRTPDMEWMDYLETLGGQAAIAIDNAQLFEGMQRSNLELVAAYDATIEGWSRAMDLRDKETEGHTLRVTEWTMKLAKKMGVGQHEITHMRRGALLHDIGKLGVPDHILHKTEGLDRLEWAVMRQHPTYAFNMLLPIAYLRPALDIPYCHHEKWDGTGYPRGLKGEEIPLAARIFAIVDVWDALRSDRPYRRGWVKGKVREHLVAESGRHFDPQVVDAFLQIIEDDD